MYNLFLFYLIFKLKYGRDFEFYEFDVNLFINSVFGLKNMMLFLDEFVFLLCVFINSL